MYTDQELIESIKAGNNNLLEHFYNKNYAITAHYIKNNRGYEDDAKDVFQEAISILIQKISNPNFTQTSALSTYLFAISKNIWLKHLRDNRFVNIESFEDNCSEVELVTNDDEMIGREKKILNWFAQITKHCQRILESIFYYNESIETLMVKMGWKNKHTASNQKYKCIQQLKKIKEKDELIE